MKITEQTLLSEIVSHDYRTASILDEFGIDYCCNGKRTIAEASEDRIIDSNELIIHLNNVMGMQSNEENDYNSWPLEKLVNHIENKHHKYVQEKSNEIQLKIEKICSVHGAQHPELFEIKSHFKTCVGELTKHMKKEELILFPYILRMTKVLNGELQYIRPSFESILNPINQMEADHEQEGERLKKIKALSNNFNPPKDACSTYITTFKMIKEFNEDLHLHIHLENNILFPKSISLEMNLNNEGDR